MERESVFKRLRLFEEATKDLGHQLMAKFLELVALDWQIICLKEREKKLRKALKEQSLARRVAEKALARERSEKEAA